MAWACDRTSVVQQWPSATGEAKNPIAAQSTKAGCFSSCNAALKVWMMPEESLVFGLPGRTKEVGSNSSKGQMHSQARSDYRHAPLLFPHNSLGLSCCQAPSLWRSLPEDAFTAPLGSHLSGDSRDNQVGHREEPSQTQCLDHLQEKDKSGDYKAMSVW